MPTFLFDRYLPLLSVPYPPCSCFRCRLLACLHLPVFCRQFHPRRTPCVFSVAPLYVLLSCRPVAVISTLPHILFLHSICATSAILYPYTPTYPLPLFFAPLYFYIYIYISPHSIYLSSLSHSLSVSLYLFNILVSRHITHFIPLYY